MPERDDTELGKPGTAWQAAPPHTYNAGAGGQNIQADADPRGTTNAFVYYQVEVEVTDKPRRVLESYTRNSVSIRLYNPATKPDETAQAIALYYGDQNVQRVRLLPDSVSDFLPMRDASSLWVRCKKGTGPAFVIVEVFH